MKTRFLFVLFLLSTLGMLCVFADDDIDISDPSKAYQKAKEAQKNSNFKNAFAIYKKLLTDVEFKEAPTAYSQAINCLTLLNKFAEADEFSELILKAKEKDVSVRIAIAKFYLETYHGGYLIANKFNRGYDHQKGGVYAYVSARDRIRALQILKDSNQFLTDDKILIGDYHLAFAKAFLSGRANKKGWQLQELSDLSRLPEYDLKYDYSQGQFAPVDKNDNLIVYNIPETYEKAVNDGERWRFHLEAAKLANAQLTNQVDFLFASFLNSQWGVETLGYNWAIKVDGNKEKNKFCLETLTDEETLCKLATGIERFNLPTGFNYISILNSIIKSNNDSYQYEATILLGSIYENRNQYNIAAEVWRAGNKRKITEDYFSNNLNQIEGNWGHFYSVMPQVANEPAIFDFRFRNASEVFFTAYKIDMSKLLDDLISSLKLSLKNEYNLTNLDDLGYKLVNANEKKYVGEEFINWKEKLNPLPNHFDNTVQLKTPFKEAGAYLIKSKMPNGNEACIVIFLNNTVILEKPLEKNDLLFVADAKTGQPLSAMTLEFFGYKSISKDEIKTKQFAVKTNENGLYFNERDGDRLNWIIIARDKKGRFAYKGFRNYWSRGHENSSDQMKEYFLTDRPVYKPGQMVYFKVWNRFVTYKEDYPFAQERDPIEVKIYSPLNTEMFRQKFTPDEFGGISGSFELPADATLGQYRVIANQWDGISFQVEEYKKPEFEVTVEIPEEPVRLGEKFKAKIKAKYFFGAPVTKAKVKYRVLRTDFEFNWQPIRYWDWLYGNGYGCLTYDCEWYPRWDYWGCKRPFYTWWQFNTSQPEVVMENEVEIGENGVVDIKVDTKLAKELYGEKSHQYQITAEVVDESRRTIVGKGNIIVTNRLFKIFSWLTKGYYNNGELIEANFQIRTANGSVVKGNGKATLYEVIYDKDLKSSEKKIQKFDIEVSDLGSGLLKFNAPKSGQYRLSFEFSNKAGEIEEGAVLFTVYGDGLDLKNLRFNDIELLTDKNEYKPRDKIDLKINTNSIDSTVLLFVRTKKGISIESEIISIKSKTINKEIIVEKNDMPNFFVEAITIRNGKIYSTIREIIVPPENKALNVEIIPDLTKYKPGQQSMIKVKVTDIHKNPFVGSLVISIYDKAIEYISGGSSVRDIKEFFWKWRRKYKKNFVSSLDYRSKDIYLNNTISMVDFGSFSSGLAHSRFSNYNDEEGISDSPQVSSGLMGNIGGEEEDMAIQDKFEGMGKAKSGTREKEIIKEIVPTIRKDFADLAYWNGSITTDKDGIAQIIFKLPESLTSWKINSWAMGPKVEVGFSSAEIVTTKELLIRLEAPRFFVEKDEVILSGIVHNYLKSEQKVKVSFQQFGDCISEPDKNEISLVIPSNGESRVDWRVKVLNPGEAKIRMSALNGIESDSMEMTFPVLVHGMQKLESFSGVIRPEGDASTINISVPEERKSEESELIINYSPTLAGALVDALPYLVDYPYGCTEQTLNKFIPTIITQNILIKMGLNLEDIKKKQTNLNAEEIGQSKERAKDWAKSSETNRKKIEVNPVFDKKKVASMTQAGLDRLYSMQNNDGGWGWFYDVNNGQSFEHTTSTVVNGLLIAKKCGVPVLEGSFKRAIEWLSNNQLIRIQKLKESLENKASDTDALVYKILADDYKESAEMRNYLLRDKSQLSVYGLTLVGLGLLKAERRDELKIIMENIEQFLEEDKENQTAWLNLKGNYWWRWYGNNIEANAHYLMLLSLTSPKSTKASGLVKYLLCNRKNATYWESTRDTAICIQAIAEYWKASGEMTPDLSVEIWFDGKLKNTVAINKDNLFNFDHSFVLKGNAVTTGAHKIELRKTGQGSLYYNAYLSYFTKEDYIVKAGLNLKATRKIYSLIKDDSKKLMPNKLGGIVEQKTDKMVKVELAKNATVKSGDLLEVEIIVESKNQYEYICIEDPKASGFEVVNVRSGYNGNALGAYVEYKNEKVVMFVRVLSQGSFSVSYKVRAEIPGVFSALPTKIYAMYAPEFKGNSDENKIIILE
jgi:uncharacterized protein YfaS (alpha-2-macroglobulin family)